MIPRAAPSFHRFVLRFAAQIEQFCKKCRRLTVFRAEPAAPNRGSGFHREGFGEPPAVNDRPRFRPRNLLRTSNGTHGAVDFCPRRALCADTAQPSRSVGQFQTCATCRAARLVGFRRGRSRPVTQPHAGATRHAARLVGFSLTRAAPSASSTRAQRATPRGSWDSVLPEPLRRPAPRGRNAPRCAARGIQSYPSLSNTTGP